jgi:hypothetical protein
MSNQVFLPPLTEEEKQMCRKLVEHRAVWKAQSELNFSPSKTKRIMKLLHRLSGEETFPDLLFFLSEHPEWYK